MSATTTATTPGSAAIGCACGRTRLEAVGAPILVSECLCDSCKAAAKRLAALPGARDIRTAHGATACAEYRKDRVRFVSGTEHLAEFRLSPDAGTRRVVATCCNTPVFLELKGAHWLSMYLHLWPQQTRPKAQMRTMVGDLADASYLPDDIANLNSQSLSFYAKLFGAWIAMGLRNPKIEVKEKLDA
ncbi:GFA family protein [Lysobacter sp. CA196]|uniref:GFA family protein n=1 Tax=Lysobacter sp. CA196 TaxID=3455606 RepID=UPI003F8D6B3A